MSFVEPLFLVGLLAAGLPVVVHLINRRKAARVPFPAVRFLLKSNKREARGIKVRQWLLMALRILALAALALALAKPYFLSSAGVQASDRLPTATVYVVDTSYSMSNGDWWDETRDELERRVDATRPWDEVAMVLAVEGTPSPVARLTSDLSELEDAVEDLEPSQKRTDLIGGLSAASGILASSQLPNRRIVLLTDRARGGFPRAAEPDRTFPYSFEEWTPRQEESPPNVALTSVDYVQEGSGGDVAWKIDAVIENYSSDDVSTEIRLVVDGSTVAAGKVSVGGEESATHTFRHVLDGEGLKPARVELVNPDDLDVDDVRHFAIVLESTIRTLLVNGEPSGVSFRDEVFFMERALNPRGDSESNIVPELTTREGLAARELTDYDVIVIANVSQISPATAAKLEEYVRAGGGLMFVMGDQVDPNAYNQQLGELLPKKLRGLKQLATRDDADAPVKITRFGNTRRQHPIFRVFDLPGGASLQDAEVFSYMLLEPSPPEQAETLLSYKDAAPALLERRVGDGRVLLFTTTIDDEWTNLPYRPAFLPLSRRSIQYLARRATSEGESRVLVGDEIKMEVDSLVRERVVIVGPDESRTIVEPIDGRVTFEPQTAGVWKVWADSDDPDEGKLLDALAFAVNVDVDESNLEALPEGALDPWFEGTTDERGGYDGPQKQVNLWPMILFVVTLLLLIETILGARRSVLIKLWRTITRQPEPDVDL